MRGANMAGKKKRVWVKGHWRDAPSKKADQGSGFQTALVWVAVLGVSAWAANKLGVGPFGR